MKKFGLFDRDGLHGGCGRLFLGQGEMQDAVFVFCTDVLCFNGTHFKGTRAFACSAFTAKHAVFVVGIGIALVYALQNVSSIPMMVALMPKEKFGQFCSANSVINCVIMIVANYFAGMAVDIWGYRVMFIWDFIFTIIATAMLFWIYLQWRKLGGAKNYHPPQVGA